jgi:hypothetical protein
MYNFVKININTYLMKKLILPFLAAGIISLSFITSCKKEEPASVPTPAALDAQVQQHNTDADNYKAESDQADNDINNSVKDYPAFGRIQGVASDPLCGVTIDTSLLTSAKTLIYNFDGITSCFSPSRLRSGQIKVQLTSGNYWHDAGSVLTLTYINFKVTRQSDNKSVMFNGTKTLRNENGNDWIGFLLGTTTFKYKERALNIDVTFDNSLHATWNSARITTWSYTPAQTKITFTAIGDTTIGSYTNVDSWGVNRYGSSFTTRYNTEWKSNTYCGFWRPISGEVVVNVNSNDYTLTLGVNTDGTTANPALCAYGYKVSWMANGTPSSVVISY